MSWHTVLADVRNTALVCAGVLILNFLAVRIIRLASRRGERG